MPKQMFLLTMRSVDQLTCLEILKENGFLEGTEGSSDSAFAMEENTHA